ncbi:peptidyl-prolyl cis-trans isomerase B (cyclophilin B) [Spirilliplanes yamanashiensis]|nr:peptidyl-prolyl cis-trans isomerase B (cyclophilin B) [Spirilliplanes yamanashiensis]
MKLDRQQARRAARARRRRQLQAGIGAAVALLLVVLGAVWFTGGFDGDDPADTTAQDVCTWTPQDAASNDKLKDVGTPPTTGIAQAGTRPMTVTTNQGAPITASLDLAGAPCAGTSLAFLAGKNFFDNTKCHEITAEGALRCGDPSGTGLGGPTYSFFNENVPSAPEPQPSASAAPAPAAPLYPKGTVAMAGTTPGANGSQFLIFLKDFTPAADAAPQYPIVGTVTAGQATLDAIAKIPTVDNGSGAKTKPKTDVVVQSLTVGGIDTGLEAPPSSAPSSAPAS